MADDAEKQKDRLYLAITRPTTGWGGVPFEGLALNVGISWLAYFCFAHANPLSLRGVLALALFPVVHFTMRLMMSIDHNLFRIMRLYVETHGIQPRRTSVLWAMPHLPVKRAQDQPSSAPHA